ncbi:peptidase U32 family protein [Helicobacter mustelae]|uniref:Putative protease n=1 Tax=Helicobacter mustelae (strain ATCC 43772 / CCUG 25715 / CIP 103759 / LMG 18044 / NCTC 12198 / R85-136P) TaxID=679897 RepID=D3UGA4_HELM1|nr:peptidase U32 family protein [Helicobacter mustelae]CBG39525.1 putative protease [Helicobacter mustelae 12198]SQH71036.1 protease [Helicobacter mustelae]STP12165.1 protease [Helicobacter mustelae]
MKKVQLLSPAGDLTKLKIALDFGADAVYGSVSHFSLRNRAGKNFDLDTFAQGIDYAHSHGKKVFAAVNGFPFNHQIKLLERHISQMAELGPDAFIIAAPGVVRLAKKLAPQIPIHLSTQANVLNVLDAEVFYEMGVRRIVAAREMSLKDAIEIKKQLPNLEIEIFVHGSMCFAFSGRCLISSLQNGRVPNRGSCANDCRFDYEYFVRDPESDKLIPFKNELFIKAPDNDVMIKIEEEEGIGSHIFNSKDLNLASHLKEILDSGAIDALKIEGRTKSTYYAGITARTYRMAIEDYYAQNNRKELYQSELNTLKNRGFTDGYIIRRPFERLNTQNHRTAISGGNYQVCGEVLENGEGFMCKFTTRPYDILEIVAPLDCKLPLIENEIGRIYEDGGRFFLVLYKILAGEKELDVIHSGNLHSIKLPAKLPAHSFLRVPMPQSNE